MLTTFLLFVSAALVYGWVCLGPARLRKPAPGSRFAPKNLLSENEKDFYRQLVRALPGHTVITQVAMGALLEPGAGTSAGRQLGVRAKFSQKIVDFAVLDEYLNVVALVELDDSTHQPEADAARDAMTKDAGFVTLRYESRSKPTAWTIRKDLRRIEGGARWFRWMCLRALPAVRTSIEVLVGLALLLAFAQHSGSFDAAVRVWSSS